MHTKFIRKKYPFYFKPHEWIIKHKLFLGRGTTSEQESYLTPIFPLSNIITCTFLGYKDQIKSQELTEERPLYCTITIRVNLLDMHSEII